LYVKRKNRSYIAGIKISFEMTQKETAEKMGKKIKA